MDIRTHLKIDRGLCGQPLELGQGFARVELETTSDMEADDSGLVHGGFVFGLADFAAMLAVNHPNVVLGRASSRFLKPVRSGQKLEAMAEIVLRDGHKKTVQVEVSREGEAVMSGEFVCYELESHVLEGRE
ncbi:MAG: hotdog domain-containing protein [Thermoanaerobaculia bacterium]